MKIRLHNVGKRSIHFAQGKTLKPDAVGVFSEEGAKKLLRLYPKEIVNLDNLKASVSDDQVADFTDEEEHAEKPKAAEYPAAPKGKPGPKPKGDDALASALKAEQKK